jgi:hypothetical protein
VLIALAFFWQSAPRFADGSPGVVLIDSFIILLSGVVGLASTRLARRRPLVGATIQLLVGAGLLLHDSLRGDSAKLWIASLLFFVPVAGILLVIGAILTFFQPRR